MSSKKALTPYLGMILIQLSYAGSNILVKLALEQGLNYLVFIVYRHLIAMAIMAPVAYVLERSLALSLVPAIIILKLSLIHI